MPALIRRHRLKLAHPAATDATLPGGAGLIAARTCGRGGWLDLSYDLELVTLAGLESRLAAAGLALSPSWPARWLRRWIGFQEDNLRAQAHLVHRCCCTPPDGQS